MSYKKAYIKEHDNGFYISIDNVAIDAKKEDGLFRINILSGENIGFRQIASLDSLVDLNNNDSVDRIARFAIDAAKKNGTYLNYEYEDAFRMAMAGCGSKAGCANCKIKKDPLTKYSGNRKMDEKRKQFRHALKLFFNNKGKLSIEECEKRVGIYDD